MSSNQLFKGQEEEETIVEAVQEEGEEYLLMERVLTRDPIMGRDMVEEQQDATNVAMMDYLGSF